MYVNVTILFSGKHLERKTLFLAGKHILWATRTGFSAFILQQPSAVATVTASVLVLSPYPRPFLHDFSSDHSGILVSLSQTCIMLHFNSLIKVSLKPGATHTVLFQPSGLNLHFLARWWDGGPPTAVFTCRPVYDLVEISQQRARKRFLLIGFPFRTTHGTWSQNDKDGVG